MSTVVPFPGPAASTRMVVEISFEEFCEADAQRDWSARHVVGGMIILEYPDGALICGLDNSCTAIYRGSGLVARFLTDLRAA